MRNYKMPSKKKKLNEIEKYNFFEYPPSTKKRIISSSATEALGDIERVLKKYGPSYRKLVEQNTTTPTR